MPNIDHIEQHIANNKPHSVREVLGIISSCWNISGKELFSRLKPGEHVFFGYAGGGYINHALYYSDKNNKIYCITTGMYNIITNFAEIENETDFDNYIIDP